MAKVVSLGIHIVDILGRPVQRIPEGQRVDLLKEIRITVAGTAAGTSVDMAKLGLNVVAMGAVGTDELGNFLVSTMSKYGIDVSHIARKSGVQTSATMLPIRPNGERPALHVTGANGEFTIDDVDFDALSKARIMHMGGTSLLPKLDGEPTQKILKFAKEKGLTTTFDLVALDRPDLMDLIAPCLPYVDYFMPGLEEAEMMTGMKNRKDIISFFLDRGVKTTVFKMGARGSSIATRRNGAVEELRVPIYKTQLVDTTGCGDAYCAGFIAGLLMGYDVEKRGLLGAAAAALVASGLGSDAGIKDLPSTLEFMEKGEKILPKDG
jgi:sugar/nucleoside kinase (ribokinase family)